jgi:hypothetical protein
VQPSELRWVRSGTDWVLLCGRRRLGRVVPDSKYRGMYRIALPSGRLSDLANLSWAKSLALEAADREVAYETANTPQKPQQKGGYFEGKYTHIRQNRRAA